MCVPGKRKLNHIIGKGKLSVSNDNHDIPISHNEVLIDLNLVNIGDRGCKFYLLSSVRS